MAYHNHNQNLSHLPLHHFTDQSNSFSPDQTTKPSSDPHSLQTAPNWLNNALLRTHYTDNNNDNDTNNASNFLNLHTASDSTAAALASQSSGQWLSRPILHREGIDEEAAGGDSITAGDDFVGKSEAVVGDGGGGGMVNWQVSRYKAEILAHPLYEQLLSAHVACLRIATPVDQLPRIDAQLAQSQNVVAKYSAFGHGAQNMVGDDKELDQFMSHYVLLLCSFKEQLQQHVRVHALEAVMACWEIEQSLQSLTGVSPGEGTGATMSDDEDDQVDSEANMFDGSLDGPDNMGFGPLIPTENERSLMERVRQELKHELKQGYKEKIVDIREEILCKRRAGKLPGDTTSVLKAWWQSHSKWPYPTEEDKARLVKVTGLQLKQINNWFINQRKRNWHSNASTSTVLKSKPKRPASSTMSSSLRDRWAPLCYCPIPVLAAVRTFIRPKSYGQRFWDCKFYKKDAPNAYCNFFEWYYEDIECEKKDLKIQRTKRMIVLLKQSLKTITKWMKMSIIACCLLFVACVFLIFMLWKACHSYAYAVNRFFG